MRQYAVSALKQYAKSRNLARVSPKALQILDKPSTAPLLGPEITTLGNLLLQGGSPRPGIVARKELWEFLLARGEFTSLITFANRLLFERGTLSLQGDVALNELNWLIHSLIYTKQLVRLDGVMASIISQLSITHKRRAVELIATAFKHLIRDYTNASSIVEGFVKWCRWTKLLNGTCEMVDYMNNRILLRHLLIFIQEKNQDGFATQILLQSLDKVTELVGAAASSQFASTLLNLLQYCRDFKTAETIWNYKVDHDFPIIPQDLTVIMRSYNYQSKYMEIQDVYSKYPNAHHNNLQFDYLLLAHTRTSNWSALRTQFDALFGIGKLPNIHHYEVVIFSMATKGELDSVEMLYKQMLRRRMTPTYSILQSLLLAYYNSGAFVSCFAQFQLFEKYGIKPTEMTYLIMFKVHKQLNNMEGALKLLKTISDTAKSQITEEHLAVMIQMCSRFTNHLVAQELFSVMTDHYRIKPTPVSIAALMDVYIESGLPNEAIRFFKLHIDRLERTHSENIIWVYTKALRANILMKKAGQCTKIMDIIAEKNHETDAAFYLELMRYMIDIEKDFSRAKLTLDELLKHPRLAPKPTHFELLLQEMDKQSNYDQMLGVYDQMLENDVPLNSKVLFFLIKATFQKELYEKTDLSRSLAFLDTLMSRIMVGDMILTGPQKLHPSIFAWPIRAIATKYNPKVALELFNKYNEILLNSKEAQSSTNRLTMTRSLIVLYGELEQWVNFSDAWDTLTQQLSDFAKLPSSTIPNKKLGGIFVGLLSYKVQYLRAIGRLGELPKLVEYLLTSGFNIDNKSWNCIVEALSSDPATIPYCIEYLDDKLVHGYNLIHKYRLLAKISPRSEFVREVSREGKFVPSLYVKSDVFQRVCDNIDRYLLSLEDLDAQLRELVRDRPYFMKSYLLREGPVTTQLLNSHPEFMRDLKANKRIDRKLIM
ncbi:Pet309p KNAG_0L00240 [Huiozyma naganishii CBS 8797]|uniref:Pentacotripeptide-repeat region of PRORP domain-containing protein n=1 Tax=Huiozyma naganishii (strain ATCC MYA-139 / BCRC 22969 / CBS 8797 / KCTC 17520 / NBRC 10181 / NCYC 3082 / Yp74L-3) TaxID=1071383 RepID=J7S3I7_HUIN7|nr:hypothetical protein KNAG_0L00240 [Kazachstania naganishii CBS 8797]CCK72647.1 hypothetical protein KNAG_0L00240 [Kazachstania naganishii CBS 8797]